MTPEPLAPVLVLSTAPDAATADRLAERLVDEGLAACVSRIPGVRSRYLWKGVPEEAEEVLLLVKTRADRSNAVVERLASLHPYEVPEILVLPVAGGHPAYLAWVAGELAPPGEAR